MAKDYDLFILNPSTIDNVIMMDGSFPIEGGTSRKVNDTFLEPGGEANMFIMFNRLGGRSLPVGPIGTDHYGEFTKRIFEEENIDTGGLRTIEGYRCPIANSIVDGQGSHTFLAYLQGTDFDSFDHIFEKLHECRAFYMSGYLTPEGHPLHDITMGLMLESKRRQMPVFFDPGPQIAVMSRELVDQILENIDVLSLNDEEAVIMTGKDRFDEIVEDLKNRTDALIIYKAGGRGSCMFSKTLEPKWYPGFRIEVKDTMGCGDCFLAAFIYAYLNDKDLDMAAVLANATGAVTAGKVGTGRRVPTKQEVISLLKENGYLFDDEEDILSIRMNDDR